MASNKDNAEYAAKVKKAELEYWAKMQGKKDLQDHLNQAARGLKGLGADFRKHFNSMIGDEDAKAKAEIDKLTLQLEDQAVSLKHKIKNIDVVFDYYCKRAELAMKHPEAASSAAMDSIKKGLKSVLTSFKALLNKLEPSKEPGVKEAQKLGDKAESRFNEVFESAKHKKRPRH